MQSCRDRVLEMAPQALSQPKSAFQPLELPVGQKMCRKIGELQCLVGGLDIGHLFHS